MTTTPKVSVVLPAYNAAGCIGRAIESVRAQTYHEWELIVVDDGSTDETNYIARKFSEVDSRVRIIRIEHGGIVAALNAGIEASTCEFIARMDADDECAPNRLEAQVALLNERPEIGVASSLVEFVDETNSARGYDLHVSWLNQLVEVEEIAKQRFVESPVAHPSVMFRRALIEKYGSYRDSGWPEDYELWLRWMDAGVRFAKVPEVLLRWHDSPDRLSRTHAWYREELFYACKCHYLAKWIEREVAPDLPVFLWGAGRVTRKRFAALAAEGVSVSGYIDIDDRKTGQTVGGVQVIAPEEIPDPGQCFVIGAVGSRGAREKIRTYLIGRGYVEGRDFLMAA